jgi:hypothetical protein
MPSTMIPKTTAVMITAAVLMRVFARSARRSCFASSRWLMAPGCPGFATRKRG